MTLNELNQLDDNAAYDWFEASCAAERWVNAMVTGRPYKSAADVYSYAVEVWESLTESDYRQAFEAHPMIGEDSLRDREALLVVHGWQHPEPCGGGAVFGLARVLELRCEWTAKTRILCLLCCCRLPWRSTGL